MMMLKPTIIGLSAIYPSPRGRGLERAKPNNLKKTSSEKDGNTKTRITQTTKEKHKTTAAKYVSDDLFYQNQAHVV